MNEPVYCFVGDLLGFKKIIKNLDPTEQEHRVRKWVSLVRESARKAGVEKHRLMSDTVVAIVPNTPNDFLRLVHFARLLLENGTNDSLLLRGGICLGEVTWEEDIVYGKALSEAYELGMEQNWIGVACSPMLAVPAQCWQKDTLVAYPAPKKSGTFWIHPVVSWHITSLAWLVGSSIGGGLTQNAETIQWDWVQKIQNTLLFRWYQRILKRRADLHAEKFTAPGLLPIALADSILEAYYFRKVPQVDSN